MGIQYGSGGIISKIYNQYGEIASYVVLEYSSISLVKPDDENNKPYVLTKTKEKFANRVVKETSVNKVGVLGNGYSYRIGPYGIIKSIQD